MKDTIVVVTCLKDQWNFEMLCISIAKYLEPCRLVIIYNDDPEKFDHWNNFFTKKCYKFLAKHKVTVKTQRDYWNLCDESHLTEPEKEGWVDQQVLKLVVAKDIKNKNYLCLDSKNFFIQPCNVNDIKQIEPEPIHWTEDILENWVKYCCKTLKLKYPGPTMKLTQNTTPYWVNTAMANSLVTHFNGIKEFYKWFTITARMEEHSPSEFFLYEIWCKKQQVQLDLKYSKQNSASMWGFQIEEMEWGIVDFRNYIRDQINSYDVRVAGFHKTVKSIMTERDLHLILQTSGNHDILPKFTPYV
jgi:hypothetical protein